VPDRAHGIYLVLGYSYIQHILARIWTVLWQFFASDERIKAVRQMIMAPTVELRQQALDRLLPYQRSDFEGIFRAMDGK
jgi:hypothetical protein